MRECWGTKVDKSFCSKSNAETFFFKIYSLICAAYSDLAKIKLQDWEMRYFRQEIIKTGSMLWIMTSVSCEFIWARFNLI